MTTNFDQFPASGDRRQGAAFEALLGLAAEIVVTTDRSGIVTWTAPQTPARVGLPEDGILAADWKRIVGDDDTELARAAFDAACEQPGHPIRAELLAAPAALGGARRVRAHCNRGSHLGP